MLSKVRWVLGAAVAGAALVSASGFTLAPALAQGAQCNGNPLYGTWRLNKEKSTITRHNGVIPGRIVIIAPFGKNGMTYVFIDDDDKRLSGREETWSVQFDGKPWPTTGGDPRLLRWKRVDCNTFEMETLRQLVFNRDGTVKQYVPEGQVQSHSQIVVAPDGKTYTTTHSGQLGDGSKYDNEIMVFDRL